MSTRSPDQIERLKTALAGLEEPGENRARMRGVPLRAGPASVTVLPARRQPGISLLAKHLRRLDVPTKSIHKTPIARNRAADEIINAINDDLEVVRQEQERPPWRIVCLVIYLPNGEAINVKRVSAAGAHSVRIEGHNIDTGERREVKVGASAFQYDFVTLDRPPFLRLVD